MEIFSTFVADIYGVSLQIRQHVQISPKLITLFIMLTCFLISQFGFSSLLSVLYPIFGMLSLMWVSKLIIAGRGRPSVPHVLAPAFGIPIPNQVILVMVNVEISNTFSSTR